MKSILTIAFVLGALTIGWPSAASAAPTPGPAGQTAGACGDSNDLPGRFGEKLGSRFGMASGAVIGAKIGMAFGPCGALFGAFIGGLLGETLGSALGENLFGMQPGRPQLKPR